ncbi:MAG: hypothetical protein ACO3I0_08915, partial [Limisphaerales bacterium]
MTELLIFSQAPISQFWLSSKLGSGYSTPIVADDGTIFQSVGTKVFAIDPKTSSTIWIQEGSGDAQG